MHGKPPQDTHRLALLEDNLYWNDGQMRDEVYNWGSFVQSRMHAQGVTCSDCHDPHSLKLRAPANAVCAQCHLPAKFDTARHTHHAEGTPGAACAACHMPTTTYMGVDARHDHSLRIPRPDVSAALGTPNACTNCHAKQTAQWAADAILRWTGKPPASYQDFGAALHAGSLGAPGARGALLRLIEDKAEPALVRASAIERLGRLATPVTIETLARELNDPDPGGAARDGRGPRERGARDAAALSAAHARRSGAHGADRGRACACRSHRIAARRERSRGVREGARRVRGGADLQRRPAGRAHEPRQPRTRSAATPRPPSPSIGRPSRSTPRSCAAYANLADLYRARGAEGEAAAVLREGLARNPRAAVLHHALGLALVRQKQTAESLKSLRAAAELAPENARFAYVYAVALNGAGKTKEALAVLAGARKREPYDRDVLSGLAFFTAQSGDREAALGYVKALRELDPENPQYARMAQEFGGTAARK